ncbi:hypothetical protein B6N60_04385 [Richelia sinica FACHB-800]|uniref:Uncharacterized protein n=1 Tax=Richelia sinica FACHB-800 TaxID=1357546 RepID=A0A975Y6V0_9NOST|nr:hypothetical protein B6N60_04385 [Richelia sinica FACHB-800]
MDAIAFRDVWEVRSLVGYVWECDRCLGCGGVRSPK